jgi:TrwC relaxase
MSIHKLNAGSGYDYLTRQVAALDATEKGHVGLASYYTERGESPGLWIGSGIADIDGLNAGDAVTAEQMRALFGAGMHPLGVQRLEQLRAAHLTDANMKAATQLGAPFKVYAGDVSPFRLEVASRIGAINTAAGLPVGAPLPAADRARVRTEVAREFSCPSMAESRWMPENWRDRSRKTRGHEPKQLPGMTLLSPQSSRCRACGRSPTRTSRHKSRRLTGLPCRMR